MGKLPFIITGILINATAAFAQTEAPSKSIETAPSAEKASEEVQKVDYLLCRLGRQVRSLRVNMKDGLCTAVYTKNGVDQVVGKSGEKDMCYRVAFRIRKNLEVGEWKCRDVSNSKISFTE